MPCSAAGTPATVFRITVRAGSRRNPTAQRTGTYVACLDCGKEFRYDWQEMKIVGSQTREVAAVHGYEGSRVEKPRCSTSLRILRCGQK